MKNYIALIIASLFISGCGGSDKDSNEVKTSKMYAEFEVIADPHYGGTVVNARLRTGSLTGDYIQLNENNDILWAEGNQLRERMASTGIYFPNSKYTSGALGATAEGAIYKVSLERKNLRSARNSTVSLPSSFEISMPRESETLPRNKDITIAWTPGKSSWIMEVHAYIYCYDGVRTETNFQFNDADGVAVITPSQHSPKPVSESAETCTSELLFRRINKGAVDGEFGGGYINSILQRSIRIYTTAN